MISEKNASTRTGPYKELRGLSSETKPYNVANGSVFEEIDTGAKYMYDAAGLRWDITGGGQTIATEELSITQNGIYTPPTGKAYAPVTVNVPSTGDAATYTKSFTSPTAIKFSEDEMAILSGSVAKIVNAQITYGSRFSWDSVDGGYFSGLALYFFFVMAFGYIQVGTTGSTPHMYAYGFQSGEVVPQTISGAVTITFYVTPAQKAQLDAL